MPERVLITRDGAGGAIAERSRADGFEPVVIDLGGDGIRAALFERTDPSDAPRARAIVAAVPARRIGEPEEIAQAASFLMDARSGFVRAQVLNASRAVTVGSAGA